MSLEDCQFECARWDRFPGSKVVDKGREGNRRKLQPSFPGTLLAMRTAGGLVRVARTELMRHRRQY
jgi:hypothetical protein